MSIIMQTCSLLKKRSRIANFSSVAPSSEDSSQIRFVLCVVHAVLCCVCFLSAGVSYPVPYCPIIYGNRPTHVIDLRII